MRASVAQPCRGKFSPAYSGTLKEVAGVLASWAMGCLGHPTE
jgi:hypothetical protein